MSREKLHKLIEKALRDEDFKKRLIQNPKKVFEEWEIVLPNNMEIEVLQNSPKKIHIVLPTSKDLDDSMIEGAIGGITIYPWYESEDVKSSEDFFDPSAREETRPDVE